MSLSRTCKKTGLLWALCVLCGSIHSGCSSKVSIEEWQQGLEQYADEHESGDLSFLREGVGGSTTRGQFSLLGDNNPDNSTDVTGVFLGRREIGDHAWLIFLVGQIKKREVQEIRLAMLSDEPAGPLKRQTSGLNSPQSTSSRRWLLGDGDEDALEAYVQTRDRAWRVLHPGRSEPPLDALSFPAEEDVFELETAGNTVSAVHPASGARWTIVLPK